MVLLCSSCAFPSHGAAIVCATCGELLEFALDAATLNAGDLRRRFAERRLSNAPLDSSGVWRFRELLPAVPPGSVVTLRENAPPLLALGASGAAHGGHARAAYLHLGANPTASFKDAGMTVAISNAAARGARAAICASTGNTAAAMAAYAARAGMAAVVLVPAVGVSEAKMAQTLDYGAHVVAIDGDFDRALRIVRAIDPERIAIVNSVNPYRIEGQKCAALAMLEARDWRAPDWVVLPGGNLGNTTAFGKGLREALALKLIDRLPRIATVQAAGAAPFVAAFESGRDLVPVTAETTATAIKIGAPASWKKALAEIRQARGVVVAVTDAEIADARAAIGRDGIGCEPASAASLAGLRRLRDGGTIAPHDDVVLVLTGHVLKDTAYAARYHASHARYANAIEHASGEAELAAVLERLTAGPARVTAPS